MEQLQASELPRAVPWLLDQAESGNKIGLYRRGQVVAVVVPISDYDAARLMDIPWEEAPGVTTGTASE